MISRRKLVEVSQVHHETARILKVVSTVGPACNSALLRGVNCGAIAKDVEEHSRYINEHSSHFTEFFENKAKELCEELHPDVEALSEVKSFDEKIGRQKYLLQNKQLHAIRQRSFRRKKRAS